MPAGLAVWAVLVLAGQVSAVGLPIPDAPWYRKKDKTINQSTVTFESGGKTITVERFEPKEKGKYPAVLVVHGADGLQFEVWRRAYRGSAQELARHGYVALLVHYFDRTGTRFGDSEANKKHFLTWMKTLGDAVGYAAKLPNVAPGRVGLVGVSLGAYLSVSLAAHDARIGAVVEFFGGVPPQVADNLKRMPPTLILHGDADYLVPVAEARKLERVLADRKLPHEVKVYAGQGHGFTGADATDAMQRTLAFLDKHLKNAKRK